MRFTRILQYLATAICLMVSCFSCRGQDTTQKTQKKRVAVLNFEDDSGGSAAASKVFGATAEDVGKGVSAQIIEKLTSGGKYTVVDRSALKLLLEEQNASATDSLDAYGMAARIGRILGLDAMIIGAITRFGPEAPQQATGGGRAGIGTRKSKAYVDITARVLDMNTAVVIAGFTATGESTNTGTVTVIKGHGHSQETQEILGSEFVDNLLGEATRNAVEKIAEQLDSFAEKIPTLKMEMDGLVAEVAGNSITLNFGKKSGLKVGDKLSIARQGRAVVDPQTGRALPPVLEPLGEATVTEVANDYATAIFSGSVPVHVGDHVKSFVNSQFQPH